MRVHFDRLLLRFIGYTYVLFVLIRTTSHNLRIAFVCIPQTFVGTHGINSKEHDGIDPASNINTTEARIIVLWHW